jgi:hypothetical protein
MEVSFAHPLNGNQFFSSLLHLVSGNEQFTLIVLNSLLIFLHAPLNFLSGNPNQGYNLIVVDSPWENGCVHQKEA